MSLHRFLALSLLIALSCPVQAGNCDCVVCDVGCNAVPSNSCCLSQPWCKSQWLCADRLFDNCTRKHLEGGGVSFEADLTQFYQGVASGGVTETFNYAGHGDYAAIFDFGKIADMRGLSLLVRGEHRYGEFVASDAGEITPANLWAAAPTIETTDMVLTNFILTRVINEKWTVFTGKMDTLEGDRNPFASGKGKTGFFNTSLVEPVIGIPAVPFATLGAGAVYSVDGMPAASILVLNGTDTTLTSGFDELFEEGVAILGNVNVPLPIRGKMGIHTFSIAWNSRDFTELGQDPRVIGGNAPIARTSGAWAAWWSGAQYLYQDPCDPMKGWGLFARFGMADDKVSPIEMFTNIGIGGQSPIRGRKNDQFGIGFYYNDLSSELGPIATNQLGIGSYASGFEMFYNYYYGRGTYISPDLQLLEPGQTRADTALVLGLRVQTVF